MMIFVDVNVAGVMTMVMVMAIFVDVIVRFFTGVIRTMNRNRMVRLVRRMVRFVGRRVIAVDVIGTSDDFSRRSRRKGGKNESNEDFELHIYLEY